MNLLLVIFLLWEKLVKQPTLCVFSIHCPALLVPKRYERVNRVLVEMAFKGIQLLLGHSLHDKEQRWEARIEFCPFKHLSIVLSTGPGSPCYFRSCLGYSLKEILFFPLLILNVSIHNCPPPPSNCWFKKKKRMKANQEALVICSSIFPA